jgi:hypothetical protein
MGRLSREARAKQEAKDQKLRQLVLYLAERSQNDQTFGAAKQNKLLLYSDFLAYISFGQSITDQQYSRVPNGPAPKRWPRIKANMLAQGDIAIQAFPHDRTVALRKPDLSIFTPGQIQLVDQILEMHRSKSAAEITADPRVPGCRPNGKK